MSKARAKKIQTGNIIIVKKMKDYSNEPVFRKKDAEAIAFLKKHGLPKDIKNIKL